MTELTKLDQNIFTITNFETTSRGSFNNGFGNNFKKVYSGVSFVAGKTQNWGFVETKTLSLWAEDGS